MTDGIITLLFILVAANVILIGIVIVRAVLRRRRMRHDATLHPTVTSRPVTGANPAVRATDRPGLGAAGEVHLAAPRTDALTGLLLPGEWNRIVTDEAARIHRYGRPATVVVMELDGLERLAGTLGQEAADRVLPALSDVLSRSARGADHLARLGPGRFAVMLPETGEVAAVNYVERIRAACELWLESGAIAMRLAIGWAAPPPDGDLSDAVALAQDRMYAELRRGERRATDLVPERAASSQPMEGSPSPA
jgi:diguanylate cyclase (GGDEF)-like protein